MNNQLEVTAKLSNSESQLIAQEVLRQFGGNKFLAMTGAVIQYCDNYTSCYKLRRNKAGAQFMKVTLNSMDTYDIDFIKIRGSKMETVVEKRGYYDDMIAPMFEEVTGLRTHL